MSSETESLDPDYALFEGKVRGLVATFRSDERPLTGLAGLLDWRFQGAISHCLKAGKLTGEEGECAYLPVTRNGATYHLILVGVGTASREQGSLPARSLGALKKNLATLKLERVGVSRGDLGAWSEDVIRGTKGMPLCVLR